MKKFNYLIPLVAMAAVVAIPELGVASVESTLATIQMRLISTVLPLAAIIGLVIAGLSFVAGSPNARSHFILALIGALVGFGAPSLIAFIKGMVQ